ncbi:MAG: hypothetical protein KF715_21730 [Candidatus Didemnitutus sp.]|nr:hypothetical protein [Candidatus Didemnitutus sp.]
MKISASFITRLLPFAGAFLLALTAASAQVRTQQQPQRNFGVVSGGGVGSAGASNGAGSRQYNNATTVGDAMISSDMDTRRIIVVTDDITNENIKAVIASLDAPKPQVLINVVFLQVEHDKDLNLGAEASYTGPISLNSSPATNTASTNFGIAANAAQTAATGGAVGGLYTIANSKVNATINLLASTNKTHVLSRPSILTRSGQQASVMVGQSIPIVTNSQISSVTNAITNTVTYQDIGIILSVTPFITQDGNVEMIVSPQTSSISATTVQTATGVSSPVIDKTSADTVVVTPSDQTIIIGGLMSDQNTDKENKVPLLGDIPLVGNFFKHKVTGKKKSELLIFLTPHVVNRPSELASLVEREQGKFELLKNDTPTIAPPPAAKP